MAKLVSMIVGITITIYFLVNDVYCITSPLIRVTANGPVEGIEQISSLGQKYYSFRGVPFAAPPITGIDPFTGESVDRRFKATKPLEYTWTQPLKAYNFSKVCMQQFSAIPLFAVPDNEKSEDCLYLNIYVPAGGAPKKTVLVYIFGGAFTYGNTRDTLYGPDFLLSQDNIVVTIPYRLGIFGFLNLGAEPYTGNMGLKDQQQALKWIHKNIVNFSGRNDQILLFGQSAGGISVHFHMLNLESRRYFNRAFVQSGTATGSFFLRKENHLRQAHECSQTNNFAELIEYFKTANASVLAETCYPQKSPVFFRTIWVPTMESSSVAGAFSTKTPEEIYSSNEAPVMDTMFSLTTEETMAIDPNFYKLTDADSIWKENWNESSLYIPCEGNPKNTFPIGYEKELALLKEAYFSNVNSFGEFKLQNLHFISELFLGYNIIKSTILQTHANYYSAIPKKTFLFRFDVHTESNVIASMTGMNYTGATHIDDVCFIFYCHLLDEKKIYDRVLASKDLSYDIIMRSVKMITKFARTGDPSIDSNTYFVASSLDQIYYGEVSNAPKTIVKTDIKEQMHYDTWTQTENIYNGLDCNPNYK